MVGLKCVLWHCCFYLGQLTWREGRKGGEACLADTLSRLDFKSSP